MLGGHHVRGCTILDEITQQFSIIKLLCQSSDILAMLISFQISFLFLTIAIPTSHPPPPQPRTLPKGTRQKRVCSLDPPGTKLTICVKSTQRQTSTFNPCVFNIPILVDICKLSGQLVSQTVLAFRQGFILSTSWN